MPAMAQTCAIPCPMVPEPMTWVKGFSLDGLHKCAHPLSDPNTERGQPTPGRRSRIA